MFPPDRHPPRAHAFNSLKKRLFLNPRNTAFVAQVFQPAGSRDFPVPCSKEPAAGKPPEPADRNVSATFKCVSPAVDYGLRAMDYLAF